MQHFFKVLLESMAITLQCEAYGYLTGIIIQAAKGCCSLSFSLLALDLGLLTFG